MEEYDEGGPEIIKRFMYVNRKAPYGTIYALECLEVVLVAAALRRGIKDEILEEGFRISGLGQLVEAGIQADRLIVFGD